MRLWVSCGLVASLCWGAYIVLSKVAASPRYQGLPSTSSALLMGIGALGTLACYFLVARGSLADCSLRACAIGLLPGVLWALGMVAVLYALGRGAPVTKLVLLYNTNTIVAVIIGVLVLGEAPHGAALVRVVIGAVLVTAGVSIAATA